MMKISKGAHSGIEYIRAEIDIGEWNLSNRAKKKLRKERKPKVKRDLVFL